MRRRSIEFSAAAEEDLFAIFNWISDAGGAARADAFIGGLKKFCQGFETASERGTRQDELFPGLRIIGFRKTVTIAFLVEDERVLIVRLFYGGQDWRKSFEDDPSTVKGR